MANATAGVKRVSTPSNDDNLRYPVSVATAQTFYPRGAVGLKNGRVVKADDTQSYSFLGFNGGARIVIDTTETDGTVLMDVDRPKHFEVTIEAATDQDIDRPVYWKYDNEVSFSPGTYGNKAGTVIKVISPTTVKVETARHSEMFTDDEDEIWHTVVDDFDNYVNADRWTLVTSDSGTAAIADGGPGVITLTAGGSAGDNKEAYLEGKLESFLFAANKAIRFKARVKLTETLANEANIMVGLINAVADGHLGDNGTGPLADYSGAVFFKVDGGAVWQAEVSVSTTQQTDTNVGAFTSGQYDWLEFLWVPTSSTSATCYFYLNGVLGATLTHTYTSATDMQIVLGVKNGNGTNNMALLVDYVKCRQIR